MFKNILVCSDGSDRAIHAASVAAELARAHQGKLTLLHVCSLPQVEPPFPGGPSLSYPVLETYVKDMHRAVLERTLPAISEQAVSCNILEKVGEPAEVIAQVADAREFDLVVLGSRGLGTGQAAQLGSVSYRVAHAAHCPLLLVK
jgi:nucleotide-binding universal stress UspA family protein